MCVCACVCIFQPLLVVLWESGCCCRHQVQEYLSDNNSSKKPISSLQIKTAAATALATAAIKAKLLADQEAREIQRLASTVVELQLKKANIKLRRFQLLEEVCVCIFVSCRVLPCSLPLLQSTHPSLVVTFVFPMVLSISQILERERQQMEQERAMMYTERVRQAAQAFNRHQ